MGDLKQEIDFALHVARHAIEAFVKAYEAEGYNDIREAMENLYVSYDVRNVYGPPLTVSLKRPPYEIGS